MTSEQAVALAQTAWWEGMPAQEIVMFQLFERKLCMPFGLFHKAVEEALGRPVWTPEFGLNYEGLKAEFLKERPAPSFEEILNLIPAEKRIVIGL